MGESFPNIVRYAIPFFILFMGIEIVIWRVFHRGRYETRDTAASLAMGLGNQIVGLLPGGFVVGLYFALYEHRLFDLERTWWVFLLCFLAEDLSYYWFHRLAHERRWMWAAHINHHSSQHYNLSTALRQAWTSTLALSFLFRLPLVWIGFEPAMIFLFGGISLVYQFWIHTEVIDRMGPFEWVFNTPSHHRVHHAFNPRYLDANYAGVLIIWDRIFGTFVEETAADPPRYGLVKNIATFNPFKVAFHEWVGIARDVAGARSLRELLGYTWGPPGWSPDGSRKTTATLKAEWRARLAAAEGAGAPAAAVSDVGDPG
ncbi:MAG: sterol desaturase family protein [Myxococcales bacterium]|nr:sterol desaturase family protein [Myxococcales bacterium]MCB9706374.1 sterol desaturase family protein [Myxococcales bacterium]